MYSGEKMLMLKKCYPLRPRKTMSKDVIICGDSRQKITRGTPSFAPNKIIILDKRKK